MIDHIIDRKLVNAFCGWFVYQHFVPRAGTLDYNLNA